MAPPKSAIKERIDKLIKEKKVFVVSKSYCPFCVTAKVSITGIQTPDNQIQWGSEFQQFEYWKHLNTDRPE